MSGVLPWVLGVVAVGLAVGAFFWWRRRRYLDAVKAQGWTHESNPSLSDVADLQAPPFGLGLSRSVDELVTGTTPGGFGFRVFEYDYTGAGARYSSRVAAVRLPFALPAAFLVTPGRERAGIASGGRRLVQAEADGLRVIAGDGPVAAALAAGVAATAAMHGEVVGGFDLGVDGAHLVAAGAPKDPDELASFLAALDPVAAAVAGSAALRALAVPPGPPVAFYGHPDWTLTGDDQAVLTEFPVTRAGYGHRAEDVVRGFRDGIGLAAFTHYWKTDRVETYTDSDGHTRTRTVTDHHSEPVCGFRLPFTLPAVSVNGARVGERVRFESTDFNDAFAVRAEDPKFASDVIHPRTMAWLLAVRPCGWTMSDGLVMFEVARHDLEIVDSCEQVLRGWLGRIPRFVWADRQLPPPPYLVD